MTRTALALAFFVATLQAPAWSQEAAVTRRATELRSEPGDTGRSVAALPAQSAVTRTSERQGPWVQVRTAQGATGWVHLFDLGPAGAQETGSGGALGGALRGVSNLFGTPKPATASTTAGIRGLGAEDLAQAQPNPAAVTQLEALRQSEAEARSFADRAPWRPVVIEPLPSPASAPSAPAGNPGQPVAP